MRLYELTDVEEGDALTIAAVFSVSGVDTDPATVVFKVKDPASAITSYTYGTDGELVKDSTGHYHVNVTIDSGGTWFFRFAGTSPDAVAEGTFKIENSVFV